MMNLRRSRDRVRIALSVLAVSAAALTHPLTTSAATAAPSPAPIASAAVGPITIDSCNIKKVNSGYGMGNLELAIGKGYNFFTIAFTNTGTVPVSAVTFQIDFNASRIQIGDVGSFLPGVQTTHTLRDKGKSVVASARPGGTGPQVCTVAAVTYADGETWTAPVVPVTAP